MITLRNAQDRGHFNIGWLNSYHSFSFGNYYDPNYMGFRSLRVINDDQIKAGAGFPTHGHRDMEILTYILEGSLEHKDSLGTGSIIQRGEIQRMSAGTGIAHSEFNASKIDSCHLLQIWILPDTQGLPPSYEQKSVQVLDYPSKFHLIASPNPTETSVKLHQDVNIYVATFKAGDRVNYSLSSERYAWVQIAQGEVKLNEQILTAGDGAAIHQESELIFTATTDAEIMLFDLA